MALEKKYVSTSPLCLSSARRMLTCCIGILGCTSLEFFCKGWLNTKKCKLWPNFAEMLTKVVKHNKLIRNNIKWLLKNIVEIERC